MRTKDLVRLQFLIFLLVPLINYGAQFLFGNPFDGDTEVLIQPAGWAFAVWGPIFFGMAFYAYYFWRFHQKSSPEVSRISWAGISAGLASIAFVPLPYFDIQWISTIDILWHLISLIFLFIYLSKWLEGRDTINRWWFAAPQMYLGWICAATAVSVALLFDQWGFQPEYSFKITLSVVVIVVLTVVGMFLILKGGTVVGWTVAWALTGILFRFELDLWIRVSAAVGVLTIVYGEWLHRKQARFWIY